MPYRPATDPAATLYFGPEHLVAATTDPDLRVGMPLRRAMASFPRLDDWIVHVEHVRQTGDPTQIVTEDGTADVVPVKDGDGVVWAVMSCWRPGAKGRGST